jgi:dTMP kinase
MKRRARFVVVEGLDGAGTTTQSRLLGERLRGQGRRVHVTAEPSGGPIGGLVRQVLTRRVAGGLDPAALALLFAADRLDHMAAEITPRLARGVDVVSDRFTLSSLAYQGVTTGDMGWVQALNARAAVPDLVLFLKVRPSLALRRRREATDTPEIYEVDQLQRRVARSYSRALSRIARAGQRVVVIDGEQPIAEVAEAVYRAVAAL